MWTFNIQEKGEEAVGRKWIRGIVMQRVWRIWQWRCEAWLPLILIICQPAWWKIACRTVNIWKPEQRICSLLAAAGRGEGWGELSVSHQGHWHCFWPDGCWVRKTSAADDTGDVQGIRRHVRRCKQTNEVKCHLLFYGDSYATWCVSLSHIES